MPPAAPHARLTVLLFPDTDASGCMEGLEEVRGVGEGVEITKLTIEDTSTATTSPQPLKMFAVIEDDANTVATFDSSEATLLAPISPSVAVIEKATSQV